MIRKFIAFIIRVISLQNRNLFSEKEIELYTNYTDKEFLDLSIKNKIEFNKYRWYMQLLGKSNTIWELKNDMVTIKRNNLFYYYSYYFEGNKCTRDGKIYLSGLYKADVSSKIIVWALYCLCIVFLVALLTLSFNEWILISIGNGNVNDLKNYLMGIGFFVIVFLMEYIFLVMWKIFNSPKYLFDCDCIKAT